ncbi:MAG: hypothetical protein U5J78_00795 [Parasphingorhabdus sp.]|nr:hypothetical protein [Parasphingorhabdus sp.]
MLETETSLDAVASLTDWWTLAGVDGALADEPQNWLKAKEPPPPPSATPKASAIASTPAPQIYPDSLDAFLEWLRDDRNLTEATPGQRVFQPIGAVGQPLMIVTVMPESDATGLFRKDAQILFERMVSAAGFALEECYFNSLSLTPQLGGEVPVPMLEPLTRRLAHHINLAQPQRLLLLGDQLARQFFDTDLLTARKGQHKINHLHTNMEAIASFHPRVLLSRPEYKADAWQDLQRLIRTIAP